MQLMLKDLPVLRSCKEFLYDFLKQPPKVDNERKEKIVLSWTNLTTKQGTPSHIQVIIKKLHRHHVKFLEQNESCLSYPWCPLLTVLDALQRNKHSCHSCESKMGKWWWPLKKCGALKTHYLRSRYMLSKCWRWGDSKILLIQIFLQIWEFQMYLFPKRTLENSLKENFREGD